MKNIRILLLLVAVLIMSVLTACSPSTDKTSSSSDSKSANESAETTTIEELRVGAQTLPTTLDANASISNAGIQVYYNIYDTLIMRDPFSQELTFVPGLAEGWEQISDLTWEIKLRSNVKFHDGTTMNADDVAYSLNRVINEEDPSYATAHSYLLSNFEKFEVIDDLTVHAHTFKTEPLFEHLLSDPNVGITSKEYVEEVGIDQASIAPITTGPYKVESFEPEQSVELVRFDEYWGEKAPFSKISFQLIPEISSRITALQNNEVDMITSVPADQDVVFEGKDNIKLVGTTYPMYHIYRFNASNPITDDPNLRAALDYAIDRKALVDSIWEGKAEQATAYQFADYGEPLYLSNMEDIKYDLEKAKELIAASDYNGETIEIYNKSDYYTYADLAAQAVINMWSEIGVNAKLVEVDDLSSVPDEDKELRTWSNPLYYKDPMGVIERHWSPTGEAANSGDFIPSEEYTKQFEVARFSTDENARVEALQSLLEFYRAETPFIYLYKPYESFAMNSAIQYEIPTNLRPHTLAFRAGEIKITD